MNFTEKEKEIIKKIDNLINIAITETYDNNIYLPFNDNTIFLKKEEKINPFKITKNIKKYYKNKEIDIFYIYNNNSIIQIRKQIGVMAEWRTEDSFDEEYDEEYWDWND